MTFAIRHPGIEDAIQVLHFLSSYAYTFTLLPGEKVWSERSVIISTNVFISKLMPSPACIRFKKRFTTTRVVLNCRRSRLNYTW